MTAKPDLAPRFTPLYELSESYVRVLALLDDKDADAAALDAELEQIAGAITQKADHIAALIAEFEGLVGVRKAEAQRLKERAETAQHKADRLRDYLLRHLQALGAEKISTEHFDIAVRTNPPSVEVLEQMLVPAEFIHTVTTTSVDKRAVLELLKTTGEIPDGIEIVRKQRLEIR